MDRFQYPFHPYCTSFFFSLSVRGPTHRRNSTGLAELLGGWPIEPEYIILQGCLPPKKYPWIQQHKFLKFDRGGFFPPSCIYNRVALRGSQRKSLRSMKNTSPKMRNVSGAQDCFFAVYWRSTFLRRTSHILLH